VTAGQWYFGPGQQVWARQFNAEGGADKITNDGGQLWILGLKTEGDATVITTRNGGQTELLGGLLYPATTVGSAPAFTATDAEQSLVFATTAYGADQDYAIPIRETRAGVVTNLTHSQLPGRGLGVVVPLYTSRRATTPLSVAGVPPTADAGLRLFPNPVHHQLTVKLPASTTPGQAELLDLTGRVLKRYPLAPAGGALDVQALPPGGYLLRVTGRTPQPIPASSLLLKE
jgi:hypothetical protein